MLVARLILFLASFASSFFLLRAIHGLLMRRGATKLELRNALIAEEMARRNQTSFIGKIERSLEELGYKGSIAPITAIVVVVSCVMVGVLRLAGLDLLAAFALAGPVTLLLGWVFLKKQVSKRNDAFRVQLIALFDLMAGKLSSGAGPRRAIEDSASSVQDPLRAELMIVIEQVTASKDLVGAIREMAAKYPSAGTRALVAALEMDKAAGGVDIGPALRTAAEALQADIELEHEALADLMEAKMAFQVGMWGIIGITVMMVGMGGEVAREALLSPIGIIGMAIGGANFGLGFLRGQKLIRRAGKEV